MPMSVKRRKIGTFVYGWTYTKGFNSPHFHHVNALITGVLNFLGDTWVTFHPSRTGVNLMFVDKFANKKTSPLHGGMRRRIIDMKLSL